PNTQIANVPGSCEECFCSSLKDPDSDFNIAYCSNIICSTLCPPGQEYEVSPGQCCGKCVQTSCAIAMPTTADESLLTTPSESFHLIMVGETWYPTGDACTSYKCEVADGQFSTVVTKETCVYVREEDCEP
ncbi:Hypothetical predicted protein, partial [Pelobates cultripes]